MMTATPPPAPADVLGHIRRQRRPKLARWLVVLAVSLGVATAIYWFFARSKPVSAEARFVTELVEKGSLRETVSATGTLSPLDSVEVGAEVSGRVVEVLVDVNDRVEKDQVIARIDTELLDAQVAESKARLSSTLASYKSAKATAAEAHAKAKRAEQLHAKGLLSAQELEAAKAANARAQASVVEAQAQITMSQASLKSNQTSLAKAVVKSPIGGMVLSRSVEPGQTVAASLQTPVLFTIARDLSRLELEVDVDEADVAKVHEGQKASFEVDAFPGRKFDATVSKLHNLPKADTTVVTYLAELSVDNSERLLRPGMTATASIVVSELDDVLLVPNAALRFTPPKPAAGAGSGAGRGPGLPIPGFGRGMGRGRDRGSSNQEPAKPSNAQRGSVWVLAGPEPKRVQVRTGATDGMRTVVESKQLSAGAKVIVAANEEPDP